MAIWIVAFIFSFIHFQFSGFIPRIFLGAFLGYLLYWTNNLWIPVIIHFINNTLIVIGYKTGFYNQSSDSTVMTRAEENVNELQNSDLSSVASIIGTIIVVIILLTLFALCARKMQKLELKT